MAGIGLALSGGGFRATLFHLGALRRLNEFGILSKIDVFSSVSGGSILNGILGTRWSQLETNADGVFTNLNEVIGKGVREFCGQDLRTALLTWNRADPRNWHKLLRSDYSITNELAEEYEKRIPELLRPLSSLPKEPKFIFCATNLETGVAWQFHKEGVGDYLTGWNSVAADKLSIACAVAASSSFTAAFPPLYLSFTPADFVGGSPNLSNEKRKSIALTDGGIYDNMGIEPIWKDCDWVLVSDAGKPFQYEDQVKPDAYHRLSRSFDITMNQECAVRKRWLIATYNVARAAHANPAIRAAWPPQYPLFQGTYWGISTDHTKYGVAGSTGYGINALESLTAVRTDLDIFTNEEQACLENHGYAVANVAAKRWLSEIIPAKLVGADFMPPSPTLMNDPAAVAALKGSAKRGLVGDLLRSMGDQIVHLFSKDN